MFNAPNKPALTYVVPAHVKVTVCPPALAKGSEATGALKQHVAQVRKAWRVGQSTPTTNE